MPPSDELSDYLAPLLSAKAQQYSAEARQREQELAHSQKVAALKAQERAEEERLLKLRIQAAEAERAAQDALHRRESSARAEERARLQAEERRKEEAKQQEQQREAAEKARVEAERKALEEAARRQEQKEAIGRQQAIDKVKQQRLAWTQSAGRKWDETDAEYAERLEAFGEVEVGQFKFETSSYDIATGHFTLLKSISWQPYISQYCLPQEGLLWKAPDRETARAAVESGTHVILAKLNPGNAYGIGIGALQFCIGQRCFPLLDKVEARKMETIRSILAAMVVIEAGQLVLPNGECLRVDSPYSICCYPTKQSWYSEIVNTFAVGDLNQSHFRGVNRPVEQVRWDDAVMFCKHLTEMAIQFGLVHEHSRFALPTVSQWEFAARAGSTGKHGLLKTGVEGTLDAVAWHEKNSGGQTRNVGLKEPNAWGLYDMQGNVLEWCDGPFERQLMRPDRTIELETVCPARGGCYLSNNIAFDHDNNCFARPFDSGPHLGFRIVLKQ